MKAVDSGPNLLLDWHAPETSPRVLRAGAGSIAAHLVIGSLVIFLANLDSGPPARVAEVTQVRRIIVPLIAPPPKLTQKEPNRTKIAKEVKLENLLPEREIAPRIPEPPRNVFKAPPQAPAAPVPKPAPVILQPQELPHVEATLRPPVNLPFAPPVRAPPPRPVFKAPPQMPGPPAAKQAPVILQPQELPQIQATLRTPQNFPLAPVARPPPPPVQTIEKPKLVLEAPGQGGTAPQKGGQMKIPVPNPTVADALHSVARGGGQGGIVVGDGDQSPSLGDTLRRPPAPGRNAENLEMISDPMGVDFKPYLIRILAQVRRNWFAVIPESVHMGRRGKVVLQFAIDRSGGVPKLVIAMPSGVEALDKAAIAGISASVPFPPLPKEFPGQQIRLQFAFQYNQ